MLSLRNETLKKNFHDNSSEHALRIAKLNNDCKIKKHQWFLFTL